GATGFTGGHLARGVKARGYSGTAMVRDLTRAADLQRDGIALAPGALACPAWLPAAVAGGFDVVYNIAALYRQAGLPESIYHQVNAVAVGQLIEAAAAAGARRGLHCRTRGARRRVE